MYALIWRLLPGPLWLRVILALLLVAAALWALVAYVFPWMNGFVNTYDATVGE